MRLCNDATKIIFESVAHSLDDVFFDTRHLPAGAAAPKGLIRMKSFILRMAGR